MSAEEIAQHADDEQHEHLRGLMVNMEALEAAEKRRNLRPSDEFVRKVEAVLEEVRRWEASMDAGMDPTVQRMLKLVYSLWEILRKSSPRGEPMFLFRDGPVTRAVRLGQPLLLEVMGRLAFARFHVV